MRNLDWDPWNVKENPFRSATLSGVTHARTLALALVLFACGNDPKPPPKTSNETVAANSLSEERLKGNENPSAPKPVEKKDDPTQAVVTSVGSSGGQPAQPEKGSGAGKKGGAEKDEPPPPPSGKGGGGKVGPAECERIWDKGLDLEISSNPALKGAGPEVAQMAKQMAAQKHGPPPCDATQKQYACAMAATTTARWKQCLK